MNQEEIETAFKPFRTPIHILVSADGWRSGEEWGGVGRREWGGVWRSGEEWGGGSGK